MNSLKRDRLLKLRSKIIDDIYKKRWEEVWFFPEYKELRGVKGFLGTAPIMFVAINPSFGTCPSEPDIFYYRNLKKQGFANAHLTDLFKVKRKNENALQLLKDKNLYQEAKKCLEEEIRIINPKMIVPVGKSYRKIYDKVFAELEVSDIVRAPIPHYAPQFNSAERKKKFRASLRKVAKEYKNLI